MNSYDAIKKNEDSVESLKRKHDALLNDLLNYSKVVESLKKQAESCKVCFKIRFHFTKIK